MNARIITQVLVVTAMLLNFTAKAQCDEWIWPENEKAIAEEKNVLYADQVKNEQYKKASINHRWLLQKAPNLHSAIYINGEKIFKELADAEKDAAQKKIYVDSLMLVYDMRIENCGQEAYVLNRKAFASYKYNIREKGELENLLALFDRTFELNGPDLLMSNLLAYMNVTKFNKVYIKKLTDDDVLQRYDRISEIADKMMQESSDKEKEKLVEIMDLVDQILVQTVNVNCDLVRSNMGPKFEANPTDIKLAKKIFKFMLDDKCTDDPLWKKAAATIIEVEPDYTIAKVLGIKSKEDGDNTMAKEYFTKALDIARSNSEKAEMLIQLGHIDRESGRKSSARQYYRDAVANDPSMKEAYTYIGYLYMGSFDDCAKRENIVQDRAVFLAAYKMFQLAGNSTQMSIAKEQFPSVGEIFEQNMKKGQAMTVGCWIGEAVILDTRD